MRCENCKFWDSYPEDDNEEIIGGCKRHAPIVMRALILPEEEKKTNEYGDDVLTEAIWPTTYFSEWCGEFQEKDNDNPGRNV